jgi:hypothetical protein
LGTLFDQNIRFPRYIPTNLMPRELRDIHRALFWQACHRLNIPEDRWPPFHGGIMVRPEGHIRLQFPAFEMPVFEQNHESLITWRKRAEKQFKDQLNSYAARADRQIKHAVKSGVLTPIEQPDEKACPLKLRYEWAARKYCFNDQYKDIAGTGKYSPETIRKTVAKILSEGKIEKRNLAT